MWTRELSLGAASGLALMLAACSGTDSGTSTTEEGGGTSELGGSSSGKVGTSGGSGATGGALSLGGSFAAGGAQGTGGQSATGGNESGGGSVASGGSATGGKSATGGVPSTGGTKSTGGSSSTSGTKSTGGLSSTGGTKSTGGSSSAGGTKSTGGLSSTGGTKSAGGSASTGGTKSAGGSSSTGGAKGTGGATGTGCFTAPATQIGTQAPATRVTGYGTVLIWANTPHKIVRLETTMVVPPKPPASGTLFLWPGLQPDGANFDPINNGVLQPVLTWGPSCSPGNQPRAYSTWWISGQYVNTNGSEPGYTGCNGGPIMSVNVCDTLDMDFVLSGTDWTQTVIDEQTNQTVTYSIDMKNQEQNLAYFVIEEYSSAPVSEVIFTNTTITFGSPAAADCRVYMRGQNDYVSTPVASSDGLNCSIEQIILRAQGIQ